MRTVRIPLVPLITLCVCLILPPSIFAGDEWRPVTPQELAAKTPWVEKDADAEAIFWEVRIDDSQPDEALSLTEASRKYSVVLDSHAFTETVRKDARCGTGSSRTREEIRPRSQLRTRGQMRRWG